MHLPLLLLSRNEGSKLSGTRGNVPEENPRAAIRELQLRRPSFTPSGRKICHSGNWKGERLTCWLSDILSSMSAGSVDGKDIGNLRKFGRSVHNRSKFWLALLYSWVRVLRFKLLRHAKMLQVFCLLYYWCSQRSEEKNSMKSGHHDSHCFNVFFADNFLSTIAMAGLEPCTVMLSYSQPYVRVARVLIQRSGLTINGRL